MRTILFVILLALSQAAEAHGAWKAVAAKAGGCVAAITCAAPVVTPPVIAPAPAAPAVSAAPASPAPAPEQPQAAGGGKSAFAKAVEIGIAAIAVFIAYCMATEDPDWCERQETPVWPE